MAVTPHTELRLLKCNLNLDNNNQLTFYNATAQYNYFNSLPKKTITDISYQRKDSYIRFPEHIDNIIEYNYVMYKNNNYSNKWFYAYIVRMEYENDNCTRVYIKTDVFQTWQFDLTYMSSFVEREHVNDDTIGKHTVPENLETGEYVINKIDYIDYRLGASTFICMAVSEAGNLPDVNVYDRQYAGIYSGLVYYLFDSAEDCSKMVTAYNEIGKVDAIYAIFLIPTLLSFGNTWYTVSLGTQTNIKVAAVKTSSSPTTLVQEKTIDINSNLNGYSPKNNKLKCWPYNYLYLTNNSGNEAIYHYEDFINNTPKFRVDGMVTIGCSIKCYPLNYKKYETKNVDQSWNNLDFPYGLMSGKYPTCSWISDSFTNWITQNAVNVVVSTAGSSISTLGNAAIGNVSGAFNGLMGVASVMGSMYQHGVIPAQAKGDVNGGDITSSSGRLGFDYMQMSIRYEYAKIIDDFFSMYGYKVNTVKVPNITGRSNWNYVKLINPNIEAYIPQEDLAEIKDLFSNGITLWHTTTHFLDYSQNNSII